MMNVHSGVGACWSALATRTQPATNTMGMGNDKKKASKLITRPSSQPATSTMGMGNAMCSGRQRLSINMVLVASAENRLVIDYVVSCDNVDPLEVMNCPGALEYEELQSCRRCCNARLRGCQNQRDAQLSPAPLLCVDRTTI